MEISSVSFEFWAESSLFQILRSHTALKFFFAEKQQCLANQTNIGYAANVEMQRVSRHVSRLVRDDEQCQWINWCIRRNVLFAAYNGRPRTGSRLSLL